MAEAAPTVLEVEGLEKSFPGVRALAGVRFDVRAGEVHALLGENGAGKSTLIKIVSGVYRPDVGEIRIDGREARFAGPQEAQATGIATVYQELLLFPDLTVAENVFLGHAPRTRWGGIDWRAMRARAAEILASLEVHELDVTAPVSALSVANRQRVEIAKALSLNARVLILDEPTAALPEADALRLFAIVRNLRARGVGVVYISHRMAEIFALADRVTVLRDGARVATKPVSATSEPELIAMMVGRAIEQLFPKVAARVGEPVLEVRDLVAPPVVRGVSLSVRAGEIVGLAGLIGSGRSELAQAVFGILPIASGEIRLGGRTVRVASPGDAKRHGVAYVPEDRATQGVIRPMSLRHNVSLAVLRRIARRWLVDRGAEEELAVDAIARFAIRARGPEQIVGKLSGGNQQKVVLGKWLATRPKLLIMDEPTRGIDVGAKAEIHRLMGELAAQGLAVLMISSELPEVLGMSDRILVMREGRIAAEFARGEADQETIARAMMRVGAAA
jgi:rhamnose transport system ATP-binding protein